MPGKTVLFGGPAGAGKSTLARAWCATRSKAVHVELDAVRSLIVSGLADPQAEGDLQAEQYEVSVAAVCELARAFAAAGYDVAIDDVLEPDVFARSWRPRLHDLDWRLVVVVPSLAETLARSSSRRKRVLDRHTREQHRRCSSWPPRLRVDTTGLSVAASLELVEEALAM
jgi:chloramphenicol 3-O-phosphotransferase